MIEMIEKLFKTFNKIHFQIYLNVFSYIYFDYTFYML